MRDTTLKGLFAEKKVPIIGFHGSIYSSSQKKMIRLKNNYQIDTKRELIKEINEFELLPNRKWILHEIDQLE